MTFEKNERIAEIFQIYGTLLTPKQSMYMREYYEFDLSLSEIADNHQISRSAVLDSINLSIKKLEEYEEKLNVLKLRTQLREIISNNSISEELKNKIERILK